MKAFNKTKPKKLSRLKHLSLLLCMMPIITDAQEEIIMFHNVENLFYPQNDPQTLDDDFTVEGKKHWTYKKYNAKLNALAKTYISVDSAKMPAVIGLCEIENDTVLDALVHSTPLRKTGYKYIHYSSRDIRGIDVALLYNPAKFKIMDSYPLSPVIRKDMEPTRDVLYVRGLLGEISVNFYIVHAPSRREHNAKKELRKDIFHMICSHVDSLSTQGESNFIVMGDMNDNPADEAVEQGFNLKSNDTLNGSYLHNLMLNNKDKSVGSYFFNGKVLNFDQFLVSSTIKERLVFSGNCNETFVYKPKFLISQDRSARYDVPFSTYRGMKYEGGVSDHFPILMRIKVGK
ncbi:MAG: hypothetical protein IJ250_03895 [Bacteroidales bacterium]|nr:hypothetical protein [Bacteroidales bacterium]